MNRRDFLDSLKSISVSADVKSQVSAVYNNVPEIILRILTQYPSPELFDENESRTLSLDEILHAEEDNDVPFKSKNIIPIADVGDNDFIVYSGTKDTWCMYNILDETIFNEDNSFESLFLR